MFHDGELRGGEGRCRVLSWGARAVFAVALLAALSAAVAGQARAGCAVPEPALWLPSDEGAAPRNSRVTLTLGGQAGLVRSVELRVSGGGPPLAIRRRALAGPVGQQVLELTPEAPLQPDTTYELVARRPEGWHPSQWIFGAFTTGQNLDDVAPVLRVLAARWRRADGPGGRVASLQVQVALRDGERALGTALYAVWLPNDSGSFDASAAPDVYVPGRGDVLELSPADTCPGLAVPLPSRLGRWELGLAALDPAGNRSAVQRVVVDIATAAAQVGR
jgi:hypothetical protein